MAPSAAVTLLKGLRSLTVANALGLAALMLYVGQPDRPWWWATAIPFAMWIIGPALAPYLVARRKGQPPHLIVMSLFFVASSGSAAFAYYDAFFRSASSTAALVMIFIPLYQWAALGIILLICALATIVVKKT